MFFLTPLAFNMERKKTNRKSHAMTGNSEFMFHNGGNILRSTLFD